MFFFTSSPFRQVEVELYRDFLSLVKWLCFGKGSWGSNKVPIPLEVQDYQNYSPQFGMIKIPEPKTIVFGENLLF